MIYRAQLILLMELTVNADSKSGNKVEYKGNIFLNYKFSNETSCTFCFFMFSY